jgi:hypothetical protein
MQHPTAQQLRVRAAVTRPKPALDAKASGTTPVSILPLYASPFPSGSSSSSQPSQQSQQQPVQQAAGSVQITPTTTSLDLSSGVGTITVTLTPSGSGWTRWQVDTTGSDLVFSSMHGILMGTSEPAMITVSLASVLDTALSQSFTVAGQTFTVGLPGPPVPVVSPTDVPVVPLPTPSDTSSSGG